MVDHLEEQEKSTIARHVREYFTLRCTHLMDAFLWLCMHTLLHTHTWCMHTFPHLCMCRHSCATKKWQEISHNSPRIGRATRPQEDPQGPQKGMHTLTCAFTHLHSVHAHTYMDAHTSHYACTQWHAHTVTCVVMFCRDLVAMELSWTTSNGVSLSSFKETRGGYHTIARFCAGMHDFARRCISRFCAEQTCPIS